MAIIGTISSGLLPATSINGTCVRHTV